MALTKEKKAELISKFQKSKNDTGSIEIQIAILTERISNLTDHLKLHRKDFTTQRSLVKKVATRKRFLSYLKDKDITKYRKIIAELNLRK